MPGSVLSITVSALLKLQCFSMKTLFYLMRIGFVILEMLGCRVGTGDNGGNSDVLVMDKCPKIMKACRILPFIENGTHHKVSIILQENQRLCAFIPLPPQLSAVALKLSQTLAVFLFLPASHPACLPASLCFGASQCCMGDPQLQTSAQ